MNLWFLFVYISVRVGAREYAYIFARIKTLHFIKKLSAVTFIQSSHACAKVLWIIEITNCYYNEAAKIHIHTKQTISSILKPEKERKNMVRSEPCSFERMGDGSFCNNNCNQFLCPPSFSSANFHSIDWLHERWMRFSFSSFWPWKLVYNTVASVITHTFTKDNLGSCHLLKRVLSRTNQRTSERVSSRADKEG